MYKDSNMSFVFTVMATADNQSDEEVPTKKSRKTMQSTEYDCPKEGCMRLFRTSQALEQHLTLGNCDYRLEKHSIHDRAKLMYNERVNQLPFAQNIVSHESEKEAGNTSIVSQGWALRRQKRKGSNFSTRQLEFMNGKFEGGKKSGRKTDPFVAAEEMRMLKSENVFVFTKEKYLTGQQISSFFSRLVVNYKKMDKQDFVAAKQEAKEEQVLTDVLATVTV